MIAPCKDIVPLGKRIIRIESLVLEVDQGKVNDVAPACVSHFSLVPVVREKPILKNKPALLVTLNNKTNNWHSTCTRFSLQHLYIICPLVEPAFCFWGFCWFLLLLYRFCHFHLLLPENYLNKQVRILQRGGQKASSLSHVD